MAWTVFVPSTTIRSSEVNANFDFSEGDIVPHLSGTLVDNINKLGTQTARFSEGHMVSLALGAAFKQALGDKRGIIRTASATVPMDEALAQVVVDFSGRPYAVLRTAWTSPIVGGLHTTLLEHFFESFATASAADLHVIVHYGRDNHHMAESLFKAMARAMAKAVQIDPRRKNRVPSSKGVL